MGRYKGTFSVAANYEPLVGGPFDARTLVDYKADLTSASTWQQHNGDLWVYEGMKVVVKEEHAEYMLINPVSYFLDASWIRTANEIDIAAILNKLGDVPEGKTIMDIINLIEVGGYDDTELRTKIETVEEKQAQIDRDYEALKSLIGEKPVSEQISSAIDALAPIAKTGNINDLTQTAGEYMVFNCGSSALELI